MSITLDVPEDYRNVETKVVANLTFRQIICGAVAGFCMYTSYALQKKYLGVANFSESNKIILMFSIGLPAFMAVGTIRKMKPEKFIKVAFTSFFLQPRYRKYVLENELKKEIKLQNELCKKEQEEEIRMSMSPKEYKKYRSELKHAKAIEHREDKRKYKNYRKEYGPLA